MPLCALAIMDNVQSMNEACDANVAKLRVDDRACRLTSVAICVVLKLQGSIL